MSSERQSWLRSRSRVLFDLGAGIYDWLTRHDVWREHCGSLVDYFPRLDRPLRVLDLGVGPGVSAFGIRDRLPDAAIVGLDISWGMLQRARKQVEQGALAGPGSCRTLFELICADASRLPFPDRSFDVVTGHSFLYLVPNRDAVVDEIGRVLNDEGRAVFLEPRYDPPRWGWTTMRGPLRFRTSMMLWQLVSGRMGRIPPERMRGLFEASGMEVSLTPTLGPLGQFVVGKRAGTFS